MARYSGTSGSISGGTGAWVVNANNWTLNLTQDALETTAWSVTGNSRTFIGGLSSYTGTASGFMDDSLGPAIIAFESSDPTVNVGQSLNSGRFSLVTKGTLGNTFTFDGIITSADVTTGIGEIVTWSISFQVTGQVTIA